MIKFVTLKLLLCVTCQWMINTKNDLTLNFGVYFNICGCPTRQWMVVMEAWLKLLWRLIDWWSIRSLPYKYLPRELELRGFSTQEPAWIQLSTKPIKIWINVKTLISIHTLISLVYKSIKPKLCLLRHEIVYKRIKSKLCLLRHEKYFDHLNLKF